MGSSLQCRQLRPVPGRPGLPGPVRALVQAKQLGQFLLDLDDLLGPLQLVAEPGVLSFELGEALGTESLRPGCRTTLLRGEPNQLSLFALLPPGRQVGPVQSLAAQVGAGLPLGEGIGLLESLKLEPGAIGSAAGAGLNLWVWSRRTTRLVVSGAAGPFLNGKMACGQIQRSEPRGFWEKCSFQRRGVNRWTSAAGWRSIRCRTSTR